MLRASTTFERAVALLGQVDVLVPCHGMVQAGEVLEQDLEVFRATLEANLTSVFELSRLALRPMVERGRGKLILIASMLSFFGGFRAAAYAASKGGVAQLTKALATELAPSGVNVNAHRARLRADGSEPARVERSRSAPRPCSAASRRDAGASRPISGAPPCSSPRARPTTCTASCCRSTAAILVR